MSTTDSRASLWQKKATHTHCTWLLARGAQTCTVKHKAKTHGHANLEPGLGSALEHSAKYLGFFVGPGRADQSWKKPVEKYTFRCLAWREQSLGLFATTSLRSPGTVDATHAYNDALLAIASPVAA